MITGTQFLYSIIKVYFSVPNLEFKKCSKKMGGNDVSRYCFNQNIPGLTSVICDMHTKTTFMSFNS